VTISIKMKLYIIGNGFDRAHQLPTSYSDFARYLNESQPEAYQRIGLLYNHSDENWLWKDYEANLSNIDIDGCVEKRIDNWNTLSRHEIENLFDTLYHDLQQLFHDWINTIYVDGCMDFLNLSPDDYYITFNYTNVLERKYHIPRNHICYIHNDTSNQPYLRPVIGHGEGYKQIETRVLLHQERVTEIVNRQGKPGWCESENAYVEFILKCFQELIGSLKKLPSNNIAYYTEYFTLLNGLKFTEVCIWGHSLADVDVPYFEKFFSLESVKFAKWYVSYHGAKERDKLYLKFFRISMLKKLPCMMELG